jgi:hypothetical protein
MLCLAMQDGIIKNGFVIYHLHVSQGSEARA